jgi:hypothetical protein
MSLPVGEAARILIVLTTFLMAAHLGAALFARLRQPPVIGEIAGGLLLGPSALALIAPPVSGWLAPPGTPTAHLLGAVYQLGMILMVFLAGLQMRPGGLGTERKTVAYTSVTGLVIPFAGGLAIAQLTDPRALAGPHGSAATISLVLGLAIAVTSIPVISRIMMDLGIMDTLFARTVLTVAVIEDILLYVVLAVILGLANVSADSTYGLPALISAEGISWYVAYYVAASVLFFAVFLAGGRALFRWLSDNPLRVLERRSPAAGVPVRAVPVLHGPGHRPDLRRPTGGRRHGRPGVWGVARARPAAGILPGVLRADLLRARRVPDRRGAPPGPGLLRLAVRGGLPRQVRRRVGGGTAGRQQPGLVDRLRGSHERPRRPRHRAGLGDLRGGGHQRHLLRRAGAAVHPHLTTRRRMVGSLAGTGPQARSTAGGSAAGARGGAVSERSGHDLYADRSTAYLMRPHVRPDGEGGYLR